MTPLQRELPECLVRFGATLCSHSPDEIENDGALPFAVWDTAAGEDADILGAGYTAEEAIEDAVKTILGWCPAADFT